MENLHARHILVERVVLFGSYAHKRAREGSDIDLAVIAPQFTRLSLRKRYETLGLANMTLRAPIQAIGYPPEQWQNPERGSFLDEIKRTGKVIYRNGKATRKNRKPARKNKPL
ncbi:MAG: nucleotidyltransferase domain-containing protein [Chloroflexi bacterium]|nr:nucleotidyltransferase domain-containing protein [Chloroflexota bacterium]